MRLTILLLLAVSIATALKCYAGGTVNGHGFYSQGPCVAGEEYCYTHTITISNVTDVTKTCGMGVCTSVGCTKIENGEYCCCKGDLCNVPAPPSPPHN